VAPTWPSVRANKPAVSARKSCKGREGIRGEFTAGQRVGYLADGNKDRGTNRDLRHRYPISPAGALPNENQFLGAGVYYGAGSSEASFCGNEHVFLVGGGNSAGQAAPASFPRGKDCDHGGPAAIR